MAQRSFTSTVRKAMLRRSRDLLSRRDIDSSEYLAGLSPVEKAELEEIHAALERIERGVFGKCERCETAMPRERIEDRHWVRLCVSCAAAELEVEADYVQTSA